MHKVSIVIPTYNHAATIIEALESVFTQSHPIHEIIIVDDGSTDHTAELLQPFLEHILYIRQENKGANPARNRGLKEVTGDLVMVMDADVILREEALAHLAQALDENPDASYAYGRFKFGWKSFYNFPFSAERLRQMNYIHTSALVRVKDHPGFDETIKRFQDWDVWLSMLAQGKVGVFVPEFMYDVRVTGESRIGIAVGNKVFGSKWFPQFLYHLPWHIIGIVPGRIRSYHEGRTIIAKKHKLSL